MDWLTALIPAAAALVLGLLAGWGSRAAIDRRDENAALDALITDLHLKRSLAPIDPCVIVGAGNQERCRGAVLDARDRIIETLAHLRSGSANTDVLMRLSAACTLYLRESSRTPELYQFALMDLRETMDDGVRLLSDGRWRVRYRAPGGRATTAPGRPPSRRPSRGNSSRGNSSRGNPGRR